MACLQQQRQLCWAVQPPARAQRRCGRAALQPASASLRRMDSSGSHRGGRQHRGEAAVEPPGAVATTAAAERGLALELGSSSSSSALRGSSMIPITPGRKQRLRVAVDVDEVLGRFLHSLNKFCLEEYDMRYDVSDYWIYDFAKIWDCAQDESNRKVHEFFESHHFAVGIEAIPGAYDSLLRLRAACDLMVVTSRQHCIQEPTLEWLDLHFPEVFSEVHFGNHFALEGQSRKKSEICKTIGAQVLIDDNPSYAKECAEAGIHVLLYDWQHAYPWSKTDDGPRHDRITRVRDWAEVEQVLGVLAAQRLA